ncbi:YcnI family copper-binding membrane protein [Agromyces sp. SYSU T00266]|uniref:YcnI family copper-binding membrane protein n=1 Tax=Agromyces zhanjiangensis TaxID=3158562 RepID=UPI0033971858
MRSITRTTAAAATALGAGTLLALAAPVAAQAHVSVTPSSTAAGSYAVLEFSSGHGCDGSPTTSYTVEIPESILSVTPTIKAGWDVEKVMVELDEPVEGAHGDVVAERVGQVVYTAETPQPDGYRETFQVQVLLPEDAAGERLEFPVLQACVEGENDWSESAAADGEEPERPAPAIEVTEATGDAHGHGDTEEASEEHGEEHEAEATAATQGSVDVVGRVLGITGLAVGAAGLTVAILARRGKKA